MASIHLFADTREAVNPLSMTKRSLPKQTRQKSLKFGKKFSLFFLSLTTGLSVLILPAQAAERITLRLGPLERSFAIADLERFANTGQLSSELRPYRFLLNSDVRSFLRKRLEINPNEAEDFVEDFLSLPEVERALQILGLTLPPSIIEQLQIAVQLAARQANGLTFLSILRAVPADTLTIDLSAATIVASQVNLPYLGTQALSSTLEEALAVEDAPFIANFDPSVPGNQTVSQETLTLRDRQRQRTLLVELYSPEMRSRWSGDRTPLVIISHGFGADRNFLAYLARHLASYGISVAAVEHPFTSLNALNEISLDRDPSEFIPPTELIDQPRDISFVIDELAKRDRRQGNQLNTETVTVIGHSVGGYTALAVAGAKLDLPAVRQYCQQRFPVGMALADWFQCLATQLSDRPWDLADPRVSQVIALNPAIGHLFGSDGLRHLNKPVLILSATEDAVAPALNHQLRPFQQLRDRKYLVTAINATHLSIADPDHLRPGTFARERRGTETEGVRQLLRGVTLAFVKQQTPEAETYAPFLTSGYAQSLATTAFPLRLNRTLPDQVTRWLAVAENL